MLGQADIMGQIAHYFSRLLSPEGFPARWHCGQWDAFTGWFYILSDIAIWGAYYTIPMMLIYFVRQRKDVPFPRIFLLFAVFILACGSTHLADAAMFWWPAYRLSGVIFFATALVSWVTVFALIPVIPQALSLKSPSELEETIRERTHMLEKQTADLRESENRLRRIVDSGIIGVIHRKSSGEIVQANDAFLDMVGYTREDLQNGFVNWREMTPPEFEHLDERSLEQLRNTGACKPFEKQYIRKDCPTACRARPARSG